jgi:archaellum component FlaC
MTYEEFKEFKSQIYALLDQLKDEYNKKESELQYWKEVAIKLENELNKLKKENEELKKVSLLIQEYSSFRSITDERNNNLRKIEHNFENDLNRIKKALESVI